MSSKIYTWAIGEIKSVRLLKGQNGKEFVEVALNFIIQDKENQDVFMTTYLNFNKKEYEKLKNSIGKYMATVFKTYLKSDEKSELKTFTHDKSINYLIFEKNPLDEKL
ncbi:hypothetical protein [Nitrosophilus kaiyonis]|uniref:hypothetical protein n=1 Tax=Nitrosophilus kaiyonis TaxID=2930200 RepID=UPI002491F301|nr:hypothetical protein [Nitrosophilus kaiyonis]